ncbi:putative DNA-binding transcriptional regulator YafY [Paenibacillus endophyticus]|uniref:Putative DNA-binding transcriptional regulator YafY n=1 Tax=Paenibacillus endophyticus TaxID=1294268 RepID=A0A7W5GBH5_9BACL|nr:YafY family protein [Paenibacillus endophyticus]MBB3153398.1 putative DNA-binding transcriptional regulator YafY [Paenibacillus endophyticus]
MSKSKRLIELMMTVNRKRKFTVKELAQEFEVSTRTILRDLQELSELGVPLYSEVGPHGGYQVLKERILPPIAFTEEEAVAIFFASHALRHYAYLPFKEEAASALSKFYFYMTGEVRDRIDQMKHRIDIFTPERSSEVPFLSILLEASIHQKVLHIGYDSREGKLSRPIQPIGLYASNGFWYCPAYCYLRKELRLFRCDRIQTAEYDSTGMVPMDFREVHLGNRDDYFQTEVKYIELYVELSREGVQRCETELWPMPTLHVREDGTGWLDGKARHVDIPYYAKFFMGLGNEATVKEPAELIESMKVILLEMMTKYV